MASDWAGLGLEKKATIPWLSAECPAAGHQTDTGRIGGSKERVQDLAGAPAVGEQFAVTLFVE
jgi:hypothetical protein